MHELDLTWTRRSLTDLAGQLPLAPSDTVSEVAVELAALLELAAELVGQRIEALQGLRDEIARIDEKRAQRELLAMDRPERTRRLVPWQLRRQALAWLWKPYTGELVALAGLVEALEASASRVHALACRVHGATAVAPLVRSQLARLVRRALADLESHERTLAQAERCHGNLVTVRAALAGEGIGQRPQPLEERAPDAIRAAARAVVPLAAREAALSWLWQPHLQNAAA